MDAELALGVGAALGLLVGVGAVLAVRVSERLQRGKPDESVEPEPVLPLGVASVLSVLPWSAVVLDETDHVLRSSAAARARGLVEQDRVRVPGLVALASLVRKDGDIRSEEIELGGQLFNVHVAPIGGTGAPGTVLVLAEDLTEVRRVEDVRRDFVANVSHELKTPVGALTLLADTVEAAADDPEAVRHFAARMRTEAQRLSQMVQEIVLLSRLQGAGSLNQPEPVGMQGVVAEAIDRCRLQATAKNIDVTASGVDGVTVLGDEELLTVALRNIIDNAVAYSPARTRVNVRVVRDGGHVEISVSDQGIGISPRDQQRIFERFYRVDPARSRETGGTGLGLAIVKHVMSNHGGDVRVWSKERLGSTFTLRLPLEPQSAQPSRPAATESEQATVYSAAGERGNGADAQRGEESAHQGSGGDHVRATSGREGPMSLRGVR
ncbi:MAG: two-component sensor histidine kinase [Streptosporangiales bacterium]|nr:two-component sensor histidine kinase [Streptosporangiales bacterium]